VFISNAFAQAAAPAVKTGDMASLLAGPIPIFALMFAVMYFLMIRPQQKRAKEQKLMMDALAKGDEVVTASGILGKISKVGDTYVTVEVAPNTEVSMQKHAITTLLPKGTLKSL
jgi:preprotein translocase subunit YajC